MTVPDHTGTVQPDDLVAALLAAGWTTAGGQAGKYTRLNWPITPDGRPRSAIVPLDPSFGDYGDLLNGTLAELTLLAQLGALAGQVLATVLPNTVFVTTDGGTHWLECFARDINAEHGYPIHPISPGDAWPELVAKVTGHRCLAEGGHTDA